MEIRKTGSKRSGKIQRSPGKRRGIPELVEGASENLTRTLAWQNKASDTRQVQGRKTEKKYLKANKIRQTPNSGAGSIKYDGSTDEAIIELKDANKSFVMNAKYLEDLFKYAVKQSKEAMLVIQFPNLIVECHIKRKGK